ncbi:MAG TPA: 5'/3'-nucleotidase SurE [Acidimicrobiia bacterium]|nr:5'/3'-nucleotidase SurE [Acidimicrobiia bacterium]
MRRGVSFVCAVALALPVLLAAPAVAASGTPATLRILVTNDDGVKAPGIDALVQAVRELPNVAVTVAAPADNQTGAGDRANPDPGSITATTSNTASGYRATAVNGSPADSVVWALRNGTGGRPDVVLSGVNAGENLGITIQVSGTVGAARTAARHGIRALAVSQGNGNPPDFAAGAAQAVAWVRAHRAELLAARSAPPRDLVGVDILNVPTCAVGSVRGLVKVPVASAGSTGADCASRAPRPNTDVAAFAAGFATLSETQSSAVCTRMSPAPGTPPTLQDPVLTEVSGVAASRSHPTVLWVHNDSGGAPAAYAITPDGKLLGMYPVQGARAVDWEDIAVGPGPKAGVNYLYLGDIGDDRSNRPSIVVYRVPEPEAAPDGTGTTLTGTEKFTLHYPDHPVDAESLLVDPRSGDLFVIDKEYTSGVGNVFRVRRRQLVDGADVTMRQVASFTMSSDDAVSPEGTLPGNIVTGADVSPDGSLVLVRTYRRVLAFVRPPGASLAAAFGVDPCYAPQTDEPQGEAVGFSADGKSYFTISEGVHAAINKFAIH